MRGQFLLRVGAVALFWTLALAFTGSAFAAGLKCVCTNCKYQNGRTEVPYSFDPNFNSTVAGRQQYNAAEQAAMNEADQAAVDAIAAAMTALPSCPDPCEPQAAWDSSHGPPFAGGTNGAGLARSVWKVTYSCFRKVVVPPPPPPPPNGGVDVVPGGLTIPPLVPVTTDCPGCQYWVDVINNLDRQIAEIQVLLARYPAMMNANWSGLVQELQWMRYLMLEGLESCESHCPTQDPFTPPEQNPEPPAQGLPFDFGFGRFGTDGQNSGGDDFKKGPQFKKKP